MSLKHLIGIAGFAALLAADTVLPATAQTPPLSRPGAHPRIEINPRPPLYRRCASWYVLQYRPSGTVLFPEKHCWWVRG
ncbi:MAG: hypothetical protein ABSA68_02825 [Xanthobacteraceae bacterium]|jgi:hypothetical protein